MRSDYMTIEQQITDHLRLALEKIGIGSPVEISLTASEHFGDYSTSLPLKLTKHPLFLGQTAVKIAQLIVETLLTISFPNTSTAPEYTVKSPGFINIVIPDSMLMENTRQRLDDSRESTQPRQKIVFEYSSPNIAKPFTVGHLRSTIIGDALANLFVFTGHTVYRDNHVGDWGTQFGKLITTLTQLDRFAPGLTIEEIAAAPRPVKILVDLYVRFHNDAQSDPSLEEVARDWFTRLEHGDEKARILWNTCVEWSWKEFDAIYDTLGVKFTENAGRGYPESFVQDLMPVVLEELSEHPEYFRRGEDGAMLFFFPNDELPPLMITKKDGSSLYATRDLAMDKFRLAHYGKDVRIVNEVGAEQELYFRQLYRIEELLGWYQREQRIHVKHGHFRFESGKMSTRKGNVIWLEDVIAEAKSRAFSMAMKSHNIDYSKESEVSTQSLDKTPTLAFSEIMSDTAASVTDPIAIGAIKWNDLKRSSHLDVVFLWDDVLAMQGNSGPYLQYSARRARSILEKADQSTSNTALLEMQLTPEERRIARQLLYWDGVLMHCEKEMAVHHLCTYLYALAQEYNAFYGVCPVIGDERQSIRLLLTKAVEKTLTEGLGILGIAVPRSM